MDGKVNENLTNVAGKKCTEKNKTQPFLYAKRVKDEGGVEKEKFAGGRSSKWSNVVNALKNELNSTSTHTIHRIREKWDIKNGTQQQWWWEK